MIRTTIRKSKVELHDSKSNHKWFFNIDHLAPKIEIFRNGVPKGTVNHIEYPLSDDFLMRLTEGLK